MIGTHNRMKYENMKLCGLAVAAGFFALASVQTCSGSEDGSEIGFLDEAREWVFVSAFAEIQSAYLARGMVVDSNPFSAQFVNTDLKLGEFGRIGGHAWSVTSLSRTGQGAPRRNAYNEVDYNLHYVYDWEFAEDWKLENRVARQWVTLPGYRGKASTFCEWHAAQALHNPWVTPYWLLRHCRRPSPWNYWAVGMKRTFGLTEDLFFTVDFFGELGDARHFATQYGPKPDEPGSRYHGGLQALNLILRMDYKVTDYFGIYAFVWQFNLVSEDARDAVKASTAPESKRDLTVFGVGMSLNF